MIAKIAAGATGGVWIERDSHRVDAASIIDILTLGCAMGTEVTLQVENDSDSEILEEIAELIEHGLKD